VLLDERRVLGVNPLCGGLLRERPGRRDHRGDRDEGQQDGYSA